MPAVSTLPAGVRTLLMPGRIVSRVQVTLVTQAAEDLAGIGGAELLYSHLLLHLRQPMPAPAQPGAGSLSVRCAIPF